MSKSLVITSGFELNSAQFLESWPRNPRYQSELMTAESKSLKKWTLVQTRVLHHHDQSSNTLFRTMIILRSIAVANFSGDLLYLYITIHMAIVFLAYKEMNRTPVIFVKSIFMASYITSVYKKTKIFNAMNHL